MKLEAESSDVTILHYEVDAQIGGKLAQLGGRLIDSTSKKLAGEFFAAFGEAVGNTAVASAEELTKTLPASPRGAAVWPRLEGCAPQSILRDARTGQRSASGERSRDEVWFY